MEHIAAASGGLASDQLGGYPFREDPPYEWAAVEGKADWWAVHHCAPTIWRADETRNATFRSSTPASVRARCDREYTNTDDQHLCYRIAQAASR